MERRNVPTLRPSVLPLGPATAHCSVPQTMAGDGGGSPRLAVVCALGRPSPELCGKGLQDHGCLGVHFFSLPPFRVLGCQTGVTRRGERYTLSPLRKLRGEGKSPDTHAGILELCLALEVALTAVHSSLGLDNLLGQMAVFKLHDF